MTYIFPEETVAIFQDLTQRSRETAGKGVFDKKYDCAKWAMDGYEDKKYGFCDSLLTGHYAPWPHESFKYRVGEVNCTTIIPHLYLAMESVGIPAQIVQFINFRDIKREDTQETFNESHFAVIIDVGRRHKYLMDPFWSVFGPIREESHNRMRIGKNGKYKARTREFSQLLRYTPREFATLMERLHDPAQSLDMLLAGQKVIKQRTVNKTTCSLMAYYGDSPQQFLRTRLYIPQVGLDDKAIYCDMSISPAGEVDDHHLTFYTARDSGWKSLVGETKVAATDYRTLRRIKRHFGSLGRKQRRIVPELSKRKHKRKRETLLALVDGLFDNLSREEQQALRVKIAARTLYEHASPRKEYVFTQQEHDVRINDLIRRYRRLDDRERPWQRKLFRQDWKLYRYDERRVRRWRRKVEEIQRRRDKLVEEANRFNDLRYQTRHVYRRAMDMVLFAGTLRGKSAEQLERMAVRRHFDFREGYLAMVSDFVPFAIEAQRDLTLEPYMPAIKPKLVARRERGRDLRKAA